LKEDYKIYVIEGPRTISASKMIEDDGKFRILDNEELCHLCRITGQALNSRRLHWACHIVRMVTK
jgi:hypothetical protein